MNQGQMGRCRARNKPWWLLVKPYRALIPLIRRLLEEMITVHLKETPPQQLTGGNVATRESDVQVCGVCNQPGCDNAGDGNTPIHSLRGQLKCIKSSIVTPPHQVDLASITKILWGILTVTPGMLCGLWRSLRS